MSDLINDQQCDELVDYRPTEQDLAEYAAYLDSQKRCEVLEEELRFAAECVVATVFGNTDGMSLELQLEAIREASSDLQRELEQLDIYGRGRG